MTVKSHAFSTRLMIDEAIEDAVHSDMFVIEQIKKLPSPECKSALMSAFNLSNVLAEKIQKRKLYLALFEAATLVNSDCDSLEKITTLRAQCAEKIDSDLVRKMVEKYELLIELFAQKLTPYAQPAILDELGTSRRSAKTIREILSDDIDRRVVEIETANRKNKDKLTTSVKLLRLSQGLKNVRKLHSEMEQSEWFNGVKILLQIAEHSQLTINKFEKKSVAEVIETVRQIEKEQSK